MKKAQDKTAVKIHPGANRTAIYARVSTHDKGQDVELQLAELRKYCEARGWEVTEFADIGVSGAKTKRPKLDKMVDMALKREFDNVVVWKLDRFGRSLQHLVNTVTELHHAGIGFVSLRENLDFTSPTGKLMFHLMAAFAEFERELIKERVKAGIAHAQSKGVKVGRKGLAPIDRKRILDIWLQEKMRPSVRNLAKRTNQSVGGVHKTLSLFRKGKCNNDGFLTE